MKCFKGQQFKNNIILVGASDYCRFVKMYSKTWKTMLFLFAQYSSCDGFMNMEILSIRFGNWKINLHAYLGIWVRLI